MRSILLAIVPLLAVGLAVHARAEPSPRPAPVWIAAPAEAAARWQAPLQRWFAAHDEQVTDVAAPPEATPGAPRKRLVALDRAELALSRARAALAELDEKQAIEVLVAAIDELERTSLELPGVQHWLAELELLLGVTAAQLGVDTLARTAFERAWVLDPERELGAAEAPPDIVARYRALAQQRALQPQVLVRIESEPPDALIRVDGRELGRTPAAVELRPGRHLLQLERAGQRAHASFLDVFNSALSPHRVLLGDDLDAELALLVRSSGEPELVRMRLERFTAEHPEQRVWLLEPSASVTSRAALYRCANGRCFARALELDPRSVARERPVRSEELPVYLDPPTQTSPPRDDRAERRKLGWIGAAAALLAAGVVTSIVLSRDEDEPEPVRRIVVDTSELASRKW